MSSKGRTTRSIHGRESEDRFGSAVFPIYQTSTFGMEKTADYERYFAGEEGVHIYTRGSNPTIRNAEEQLADVCGGEDALILSSGMAAISSAILSCVEAGDLVLAGRPVYGGTYRLILEMLPRFGVETRLMNADELYDLARLAPEAKTVFFETPTNPVCRSLDIRRIAAEAAKIGATTIVDNTFASPLNQRPLALGADIVVHSATKYLGGHSDLILGAVVTTKERVEAIKPFRGVFGSVASPFDVFLLNRSLKTLTPRIAQHNQNAMQIAHFFADHPNVKTIHYPGLEDAPDYAIAKAQMSGFGAMMAVELVGGLEAAIQFCDRLEIGLNAVSLGSVETLVSIPSLTTHYEVDEAERLEAGITDGLIRVSIGLEDVEDLIADFQGAMG